MKKNNFGSDEWVQRWTVIGTSGTEHTVAKHRNGSFGCSCMAWTTQKKEKWVYDNTLHILRRRDCQHILQKRMELQELSVIQPTKVSSKKDFDDVMDMKRSIKLE